MQDIMGIERQKDDPWEESQFLENRYAHTSAMMVGELDGVLIGYVVYRFLKKRFVILNLTVHSDYRLRGFGRMLLDKLDDKGKKIVIYLHEGNLGAQKFLRAIGYRATSVMRNHFNDGDAYRFIKKESKNVSTQSAQG
jgi:ribosomal protein S18 acetylase RimI-like enzyme